MANTASRETRSSRTASAFFALTLAATLFSRCSHSSSPTAPSDPAPGLRLSLTGTVTESGASQPVANARVEVVDGANVGKSGTANTEGLYDIADLEPGAFSVRVQADGFDTTAQSITLTDSRTVNFSLRRKAKDGGQSAPATRYVVGGIVKDASTNAPMASVRLKVVDGANNGRAAATDSSGRFTLTALDAGAFTLRASADGYDDAQQVVTVGPDRSVDFALTTKAGTPVPPPPVSSGTSATGRTVDALSARPLGGMTVRINGLGETITASDGTFTIASPSQQQTRVVIISSSSTVERQTGITVPGSATTLTLIPTEINLGAFDQMFRGDGALHRWVSAPRLLIQRRELIYTGSGDSGYIAGRGLMSDDDVQGMVDDLTWALPQLTGGAFSDFAEVAEEAAREGDAVSVVRPDYIVVARFGGLTQATSYWGYTRWAWNGGGVVVAGVMMLDRDFEVSTSPFHRSLRAHELGHALGYNHVTARDSVMSSAARTEPNGFDRDGSTIAFRRPPLNMSPDVDPDPMTASIARTGQIKWKGAP